MLEGTMERERDFNDRAGLAFDIKPSDCSLHRLFYIKQQVFSCLFVGKETTQVV